MNTDIKLGSFEVVSGKIIMSDPCYDLPEHGSVNKIVEVPIGTWDVYMSKSYGSVSKLFVHHNSVTLEDIVRNNIEIDEYGYKICVDSGQFGFFDLAHYKDDNNIQHNKLAEFIDTTNNGKWYAMCCEKTCSGCEFRGGIVPNSVLTLSGYGDGSYWVSVGRKNTDIVYLKVQFFEEDDYDSDADSW